MFRICLLFMLLSSSCLAADFTLQDVQGKTHRLSDYRGKWVLVNFWASWCPPCLAEIPELSRLADGGLVVIGIAVDSGSAREVAGFARKHGISYPVVTGNSRVFEQIGDPDVLPSSYLYSPNGELSTSHAGVVTQQSVGRYIRKKQGG